MKITLESDASEGEFNNSLSVCSVMPFDARWQDVLLFVLRALQIFGYSYYVTPEEMVEALDEKNCEIKEDT